jgi:hypothetical protein
MEMFLSTSRNLREAAVFVPLALSNTLPVGGIPWIKDAEKQNA